MFPWKCHTRTTGFLARHQILKNLSFLVFTIEMCATHTTHTTHPHTHTDADALSNEAMDTVEVARAEQLSQAAAEYPLFFSFLYLD